MQTISTEGDSVIVTIFVKGIPLQKVHVPKELKATIVVKKE